MLFILQEIIFILLVTHEVFKPNRHHKLKMDSDIHEGFADPSQTETLKMLQQLLTNLTRLILHDFAVLFNQAFSQYSSGHLLRATCHTAYFMNI